MLRASTTQKMGKKTSSGGMRLFGNRLIFGLLFVHDKTHLVIHYAADAFLQTLDQPTMLPASNYRANDACHVEKVFCGFFVRP